MVCWRPFRCPATRRRSSAPRFRSRIPWALHRRKRSRSETRFWPRMDANERESDSGDLNHAIASRMPGAKSSDSAYSICKTRRGVSVRAFDEAWINSGRIASTPPRGTAHSIRSWFVPVIDDLFVALVLHQCAIQESRAGAHSRRWMHPGERAARRFATESRPVHARKDPGFLRPWAPARRIEARRERQRCVLMPGDQPVCRARFLEQRGAERCCLAPNTARAMRRSLSSIANPRNRGVSHQMPRFPARPRFVRELERLAVRVGNTSQ